MDDNIRPLNAAELAEREELFLAAKISHEHWCDVLDQQITRYNANNQERVL